MLNADELKGVDLLRHTYNYDSETGRFTWRKPPAKASFAKSLPGSDAGTIDHRRGNLLLRFDGKLHQASRLAWLYVTGEWPDGQVLYRDPSLPLPSRDAFSNLKAAGREKLTIEIVRSLLNYNPDTGVFTWRVGRKGIAAGSVAGNVKNVRVDAAFAYIRIDGVDYPAPRLAWFYVYGEWPSTRLRVKDGDGRNARLDNLVEGDFEHGTRQTPRISEEERKTRKASTLRRSSLKSKFDLTADDYQAMHDAQDGKCAICGRPETATRDGKVKWLAVDHDHGPSQRIRDLLCVSCNVGLGNFGDDPTRLRAAADYLDRHAASEEAA